MSNNRLFAGLITVVLFCASCGGRVIKGEGTIGTVNPKVSAFNAIQVELPLKVVINVQKGAQPSVKFTGYANFLLHLRTRVENNMLFISSDMDDRMALDSKTVTAEITVPQITELYLSSTADAEIHGNISGAGFKTEVTGNSNVTIDNINTDNFSYSASGTANLDVKDGATRIATYSIDGGSIIKAFPLQTKEVSVTIKGAGNCEITALKKLSTNVSGSGAIKYKGHPNMAKNLAGGTVYDAN